MKDKYYDVSLFGEGICVSPWTLRGGTKQTSFSVSWNICPFLEVAFWRLWGSVHVFVG